MPTPRRLIRANTLGSASFRADYGIKYAYLSGAMYKGIASAKLVVAMRQAGFMGYFGAGGLSLGDIDQAITAIQSQLGEQSSFGMNLLAAPNGQGLEAQTVDLYIRRGIRFVEAAAYMHVTPALVRCSLAGIARTETGQIRRARYILAKLSRPEVAEQFMRPAPEQMLQQLVECGQLTPSEAELGRLIPIAQDICVEADSGGHTDQGVAWALVPAILALRERLQRELRYEQPIRVGVAGGIGTPSAVASAFILGADFVMTGSINQCTVEAATSDAVKDLLNQMNVQDTAYAPAGDMFEMGAKVQVLKKGLFFAARANKLHEIYSRYDCLEDIDARTRTQIEERYFKRSMDAVWLETKHHYQRTHPHDMARIEADPKQKMALIFRWYFVHSTRLAMSGSEDQRVDYQVHCGPALGAFNQWASGTDIAHWRQRHVADLAERLMQEGAQWMCERLSAIEA